MNLFQTKAYIIVFFFFITVQLNAQTWLWANSIYVSTNVYATGSIHISGIGTDRDKNVYIAGNFSGQMYIGNKVVLTSTPTGNDYDVGWDIFLAKFDTDGNLLWTFKAGKILVDDVLGLAVDLDGNSYITGDFYNSSITFGNITLTETYYGTMFLAKIDKNGIPLWASKADSPLGIVGYNVCCDINGYSYVSGTFRPSADFGTDANGNNVSISGLGEEDIFIAKYDPNGRIVWAKAIGGNFYEYDADIAVDDAGNIYVLGEFFSSQFYYGLTTPLINQGQLDLFIVKFNPNGVPIKAIQGSGNDYESAWDMFVDGNGNCHVLFGTNSQTLTFDNQVVPVQNGRYIAKISSAGIVNDIKHYAASIGNLLVDSDNNLYLSGSYTGTITLGAITLLNNGQSDGFIAKLNSSGTYLWAKNVGSPHGDFCDEMVVDISGNVYVHGGSGAKELDFDITTLKNNGTSYSFAFVAKYSNTVSIYNNLPNKGSEGMGFNLPLPHRKISHSLATDASGNYYVSGYSAGNSTGLDYVTMKHNNLGVLQWTARYNNSAFNKSDKAYAIVADNLGYIYVTGESKVDNTNGVDIVTIKYSPDGNPSGTWTNEGDGEGVRRFSMGTRDAAYAIGVSPDGIVYVTGETSEQGTNFITLAYKASDGAKLWDVMYNGTANRKDVAYSLAIDPVTYDVIVTGYSYGTGTNADYLTIKYRGGFLSDKGSVMSGWPKRYDKSRYNDYAFATVIDQNENVCVTGASRQGKYGNGGYDYLTLKYSKDGSLIWEKPYKGPAQGEDIALAIALDANDNVYVSGISRGYRTGYDYVTLKYLSSNGDELWTQPNRYDGGQENNDFAFSLAVCENIGAVFVAGTSNQGKSRQFDIITQRIALSTGETVWIGKFDGAGHRRDTAFNIAVLPLLDGSYRLVLTGISYTGDKRRNDLITMFGDPAYSFPGLQPSSIIHQQEKNEIVRKQPLMYNSFAFPNPFNPSTTIGFDLPHDALVTLKVYDVLGREVAILAEHQEYEAGTHELEFNAGSFATGLYFYRITVVGQNSTSSYTNIKKMLLVK